MKLKNKNYFQYKVVEIKNTDDRFPSCLKNPLIKPPIKSIYVKGNLDCLKEIHYNVGVIGSRDILHEIKNKTKDFVQYLVKEEKAQIISGLAKGCDTEAHRSCVENGGRTIAVIGNSIHSKIYPFENTNLALEILENDGCIISEHNRFTRSDFLRRNTIVASMSDKLLVMQTCLKSGTFNTIRQFNELKKEKKESIVGFFIPKDKSILKNNKYIEIKKVFEKFKKKGKRIENIKDL